MSELSRPNLHIVSLMEALEGVAPIPVQMASEGTDITEDVDCIVVRVRRVWLAVHLHHLSEESHNRLFRSGDVRFRDRHNREAANKSDSFEQTSRLPMEEWKTASNNRIRMDNKGLRPVLDAMYRKIPYNE